VKTRRGFLAGGGLTLLGACGRSNRKVIGVIPKATSHMFFVSVHAGVDQAARDLKVEVLWNGPQNETDFARQIEIVDSMIAQQVSAIAISATDERALVAPLERAIKAGIPVVIFDSGVNIDDYVSFIATGNFEAGCTAARTLAGFLPAAADVAMVMQKPGGTSTVLREQGFEQTIAKEFPQLKIVARQYCMADAARSRTVAEDTLAAHANLGGIFASSEAASLGSIQALRGRGLAGKVKLITFDFSKTHVEALRDGTVSAMMVQDPFRLGYESVRALYQKLNGQTPPKRQDLPARVVLKADLNKPEIQNLVEPKWLENAQ
jgi:ribose transport system substrate-binding protein